MNSIVLSLKFISVQSKFSYRLIFEIGLIITLLVSISGMINGLSGQFVSLLTLTEQTNSSYIMIQREKTLETSQIPIELINDLDISFFNYYSPIVYKNALNVENQSIPYIYLNYQQMISLKSELKLIQGILPLKENEILIGQGLRQQSFMNLVLPFEIILEIDSTISTKTITGVLTDNSFYNYGLIENIQNILDKINSISVFQFQIKNHRVLPDFEKEVNNLIELNQPDFKIELSPIQKSGQLAQSFYDDLNGLFYYLQLIMFILLAFKITHASFTLYNRYYKDFMILRILGISRNLLQFNYYFIIFIIGNIGLIYGLVIGIALPHVFLLILKIVIKTQGLQLITPNILDIEFLFFSVNSVFIINSFWVLKLRLEQKLVTKN